MAYEAALAERWAEHWASTYGSSRKRAPYVSAGDGLPAQVCCQCAKLVNTCYSFKLEVGKTDVFLRHYVSSHSEDGGSIKCQKAAKVDDAVSDGGNTVSSISAANSTSECKHKDGPRCLRKSQARFCVPGCWGEAMT